MKRSLIIVVILLSLLSSIISSGQICGYSSNIEGAKDLCQFHQGNFFYADNEAYEATNQVMSTIGLRNTFVLFSCNKINNCIAVTYNGVRYILYDKLFMEEISSMKNNYAKLSILAHEIGHHLNGHTIDLAAVYNNQNISPISLEENRLQELEADEFSGYVMHKLGATLEEAQQVINDLIKNYDDSKSSHPTKYKRLEAIERGYNNSKNGTKYKTKTIQSKTAEEYYNLGLEEYSRTPYSERDYNNAAYYFSKAIKLKPKFSQAIYMRAWAYKLSDNDHESIKDFTTFLELEPKHLRARYNRAWAYEKTFQYEKAIDDYLILHSLDPEYADEFKPSYHLAELYYEKVPNWRLAIKYIDIAWEINPHLHTQAYTINLRKYIYQKSPYTLQTPKITVARTSSKPTLVSKIIQQSIKHFRFSYSIVNEGWNSEYVRTGNPNKDTYPNYGIYTRGTTYAQYGFQFKQQLWSIKNIEVLSKTDANIGAIYRGGPTLFESSTGIDFMKDEYSCGSGLMWSFGEFSTFYRIGYNNITATFIPSEYGNRLMFGIGIK